MKNVTKKLLEAVKALDGKVPKTGYNNFSKYKYVTEADINTAVLPVLSKLGLVLLTSVESVQEEAANEFNKNRFSTVWLKHTLVDTESGESLEFKSVGTGADTLDKAVYKAVTGGFKYFLMKLFMLSGDDDPENDSNQKPNNSNNVAHKPSQQKSYFESKTATRTETKPAKSAFSGNSKFAAKPKQTIVESDLVESDDEEDAKF